MRFDLFFFCFRIHSKCFERCFDNFINSIINVDVQDQLNSIDNISSFFFEEGGECKDHCVTLHFVLFCDFFWKVSAQDEIVG